MTQVGQDKVYWTCQVCYVFIVELRSYFFEEFEVFAYLGYEVTVSFLYADLLFFME